MGPNRRQAELVESKLKIEIVEDKYLDIKKDSDITFSEFADRYIQEHSKVENKSWYEDEKRMQLLKQNSGVCLCVVLRPRILYNSRRNF